MSTVHIPVLLDEVLEWLDLRPGQTVIDATLGGGGHARAIAGRLQPGGKLLAFDRDPQAVSRASESLLGLPVELSVLNFRDLPERIPVNSVAGILLDLGLSSDQLAADDRGFSFRAEGTLDLRFSMEEGEPAWQWLARIGEKPLADLIYRYGEERHSRRIARAIVAARRRQPIVTAKQLAELVHDSVPARARHGRLDPATRTFQALRIAVNEELEALETALHDLPELLVPTGRLAIISFHSLEDRLVKHAFRQDPRLTVLTKKPIRPGAAEVESNPRSRSARLRVAERKAEERPGSRLL